ncbi:zinc finger domain-containing protein [Modestobacter marinus]|uniref:zinc finger domain-containing protein n=1 Tax=Modestobacter marinus TaxID=477641 RepID=UPI001C98D1D6|nr:zinc finger domain-containing protein [Modestobacter marinus]
MAPLNPLSRILDDNRLTGPNFNDWIRNLKIVLAADKIDYVLKSPRPNALPEGASEEEQVTYKKWLEDDIQARCYIMASMTNELQRQHEVIDSSHAIITHLKELYESQNRVVRYNTVGELFACKMVEGTSVNEHCLKMIRNIHALHDQGVDISSEMGTDILLHSLPNSYKPFIMNFHMSDVNDKVSLTDLMNMLVTAEETLRKDSKGSALVFYGASTSRSKPKGKGKKNSPFKAKGGMKKKEKESKDSKGKCFHCGKTGHWKRNCKEYLATLKKGSSSGTSCHLFIY